MKKFLQTPWGAAMVTATFFLVIMGGVAVMAKGMIDSRFEEASKAGKASQANAHGDDHADEHGDNHGTAHTEEHGDNHGTAHTEEHGDNHGTAHTEEPKVPAHSESHGTPSVPAKDSNINITTTDDLPTQLNHPDDGHHNAATHSEAKPVASHDENPHWSYEGKTGPAEWFKMKSDWAIAEAGIRQSPINIIPEQTLALPTLEAIKFHYSGGLHLLKDNGHTIQVDLKNDENYIVINDQKYKLLQFHFHATSEHKIKGKAAAMEVHLVHQLVTETAHADPCVPAPDGHAATPITPKAPQVQLAVIGVMIKPGTEAHPFIKDLWSDLGALKPNDGGIRFRLDGPISLVPPEGKRSYYRYNGSLTTPPCSENVLWTVMAEPIHFSAAQIKAFTDRYAKNNRPVLKQHRRFVLKFEDKPTDITPAVLIPIPRLPGGIVPFPPGTGVPSGLPGDIPPQPVPTPQTNAPSIGVRGGIGLPGLPLPRTIPPTTPQPR
jgi:carbonic anhydrase